MNGSRTDSLGFDFFSSSVIAFLCYSRLRASSSGVSVTRAGYLRRRSSFGFPSFGRFGPGLPSPPAPRAFFFDCFSRFQDAFKLINPGFLNTETIENYVTCIHMSMEKRGNWSLETAMTSHGGHTLDSLGTN